MTYAGGCIVGYEVAREGSSDDVLGTVDELAELSTRNIVVFYFEDLIDLENRRVTESIPSGALKHLRECGLIQARRTSRSGKVLYLTEKGKAIIAEVASSRVI